MKTYSQRREDTVHNWMVANADNQILGRFATQVASILKGKHKPTFTPHIDGGDFVVVINAEKIQLTKDKLETKKYYYFTGYRGHLRESTAKDMRQNDPEEMIRLAVWGMLPKGPLGREMISKLKIYRGAEHPHAAQKPTELKLN
ncbi:MAG: 50S ribosomal protein L13 [Proteobacteria bacterium]|nr:50S ribosomal protein L13 [Pseudomonadota bacterium]